MKLKCGHCQHQMEISDSRLPAGAYFKVKCPKCSESITGKGPEKMPSAVSDAMAEAPPAPLIPSTVKEDAIPSSAEWERMRPFVEAYVNERISVLLNELKSSGSQSKKADSVSQENLQPFDGHKRALVCEGNAKIEQAVSSSLSKMGYSLDKVKSTKDALKRLDETMYELIAAGVSIVDSASGPAAILAKINARKFEERKRTFVVLVSPELQTSGPENAFVHGANLTVNIRDLKNLEDLIRQGQIDFQKLSG